MKNKPKKKEIRVRCWVDIDGVKFFGPGRAELLHRIQQSGSISQAARDMGMSYKKAWDAIDEMNTRASKPYVIVRKGGKDGGGTELTPAGKKIIEVYKKLNTEIQTLARQERELLKYV